MFSQANSHDHHAFKPLLGIFVKDVNLTVVIHLTRRVDSNVPFFQSCVCHWPQMLNWEENWFLSTALCVQCQENWRVLTGILLSEMMWGPFCYIPQSPKFLGVVKRYKDPKLAIVSLVRSCQDEMKEAALGRKKYWDLTLKEKVMPRDEETSFFDSWGKWKEGDWLGGSLLMMPDFQDNKVEDTCQNWLKDLMKLNEYSSTIPWNSASVSVKVMHLGIIKTLQIKLWLSAVLPPRDEILGW